jgi:pimeloyl-ACP methyl ester carboxylesterase
MSDVVVVLVHGAWGSPGMWDFVVPELDAAGLDVVCADLPTMRDTTASLLDDAAHVRMLVGNRPSVLVGHSYGGTVITEAAIRLVDVRHLVYVASVMPDVGETMFDWTVKRPTDGPPLDLRDDGTAMVTEWGDPAYDSEQALKLLARNPPRPFASAGALAPVSEAPWRVVPSTYVLAKRDRTIHPDTQAEIAGRAGKLVEFDSGHIVPGEYPSELAEVITRAARA